jgi:hypothetical protein
MCCNFGFLVTKVNHMLHAPQKKQIVDLVNLHSEWAKMI